MPGQLRRQNPYMRMRSTVAILAIALLLRMASGVAAADWPGGSWQAPLLQNHPLVATIWDTRANCQLSPQETVARLRSVPLRLIGEVHDNADHHRIQAWLIARTHDLAQGSVVFEHLRADQAADLQKFFLKPKTEQSAESLLDALAWEKSGWPARAMFAPVFAVVLAKQLSVVPGDASRATVRAIARQGAAVIAEAESARLALAKILPEAEQAALLDELEASHCGLMPRAAFSGMALAQRYRDAHLARAMIDAGKQGPVTLIAGNGHVHAGRGVPWHLAQEAPGQAVVSVAVLEVSEDKRDVRTAVPSDASGQPIADIVIFTPRTDREDPCTAMRKQFAPALTPNKPKAP